MLGDVVNVVDGSLNAFEIAGSTPVPTILLVLVRNEPELLFLYANFLFFVKRKRDWTPQHI